MKTKRNMLPAVMVMAAIGLAAASANAAIVLDATYTTGSKVPPTGATATYNITAAIQSSAGFDPSSSDKLVVVVGSRRDRGATHWINSATYGGVPMIEAVQQRSGNTVEETTGIYYLDSPGALGDLVVNLNAKAWADDSGVAMLGLSGTAAGVGPTSGAIGTSTSLTTTANDMLVVAGSENIQSTGTPAPQAPLISLGSNHLGSGYQFVPVAGTTVTPTFAGTGATTVAAAFEPAGGPPPPPPPPPPLPNPVAMWDFEDNKADVESGVVGAVADKSGNGRHGTAVADATLDTDVPSALSAIGLSTTSLRLDGTDDQVDITGYKGVTGTNARTMSAWIKLEDATPQQNRSILSWGNNSGGQKWNFRVQDSNGTDGAIRVEVNGGYIVGSTDISDQEWHHVAAVWGDDGSPNVNDVLLYVDGVLEAISAQQGRSINTASGKDVQLGRDHSNRRWKGWLDDVQIFDEALSADQIFALANPEGEIPEPATLALLGLAACGLGGYVRKRRRG